MVGGDVAMAVVMCSACGVLLLLFVRACVCRVVCVSGICGWLPSRRLLSDDVPAAEVSEPAECASFVGGVSESTDDCSEAAGTSSDSRRRLGNQPQMPD